MTVFRAKQRVAFVGLESHYAGMEGDVVYTWPAEHGGPDTVIVRVAGVAQLVQAESDYLALVERESPQQAALPMAGAA